ncbi:Gfo/Idh/MocA family oxidoreductase [Salinimicrobium flavum]|uniref:Gfo/Idh/MocA family oxidoreductase n=1 Tax=Salinimicrobium flavum TaxID=1737065 RepID=A0ABW5IX31_9FLAO
MRILNTALVGYGSGGRIYNAPLISSLPQFRVTRILTSNPENIRAANIDFPEAKVVDEFLEICNDPEIELVIIVLPNHLHYRYAKQALENGKHVLVEKPFTTTVNEANELIELAKQKNLVLSVNHNRRWDSDFRTVKKLVEHNILGDIVEYEAHFDRFRPSVKVGWKEDPDIPGSGIVYDLGSHLIDQALNLFGNPTELFADIRIQREGAKVPDNFEILLFYSNLKVSLKGGMLVKEKGPAFSVFGTRGSFLKYGADVQEEALKAGKKPADDPEWGMEPEESWGKLNTIDTEEFLASAPGDYLLPYLNLYQTILGEEELEVKPGQARDVIKVIELAEKSHREKCIVQFT